MSHELPRLAKANSVYIRDLYVTAGWIVTSTFRDDQGEAYEYLLAWHQQGLPIQPKLPGRKEDSPE